MHKLAVIASLLVAIAPATALADTCGVSAGAIAYSPSTGMIGWSFGNDSQQAARVAAINACGQGDCGWVVAEQNEFAAFAIGNGGTATGWAQDLATAEYNAMQQCSTLGTGCYVARWVSS